MIIQDNGEIESEDELEQENLSSLEEYGEIVQGHLLVARRSLRN